MKKEVRIVVFKDNDIEDDIPNTPKEFMEFWQDKINLIPTEHIKTAKIELMAHERYDCGYFEATISYIRIETDEEEAARLKKEEDRRKFVENQELCKLEELKAKYGV